MKNNNVFQILVVSATAALAAGSALEDLAVGQLGVFDAETNLSIDQSVAWPKKLYFAVGLANAAGTLGDVRKSAGEFIEVKQINSVIAQDSVAAVAQVFTLPLVGFVPVADTDYVIRFTFMSGETMQMHGFDNPTKPFIVTTGATAPTLDAFLDLIVAEVNKDTEAIVVAAKSGTSVTFTIASEDKYALIGGFNPKYNYLRPLKATLSLGDAFGFATSPVTVTGPVYSEGSGYDLAQEEYNAGGFNGDPGVYRDSNLTGLVGYTTPIFSDPTLTYDVIRFNYEFTSHSGGGLPYSNQLDTVIAIPVVSTNYDVLKATLTDGIIANGFAVAPVTTTTTTGA